MENASKALLMAAGVLMGVVILSLAAYLFVTFSSSADDVKSEIANNQLNKFNSQFLAYEQREDLTVYDILTAVNLGDDTDTVGAITGGIAGIITMARKTAANLNMHRLDLRIWLSVGCKRRYYFFFLYLPVFSYLRL